MHKRCGLQMWSNTSAHTDTDSKHFTACYALCGCNVGFSLYCPAVHGTIWMQRARMKEKAAWMFIAGFALPDGLTFPGEADKSLSSGCKCNVTVGQGVGYPGDLPWGDHSRVHWPQLILCLFGSCLYVYSAQHQQSAGGPVSTLFCFFLSKLHYVGMVFKITFYR